MWEAIRARFIEALTNLRVDKWVQEETRNTSEVGIKYRSLNDISAFADWLDMKVKQEQNPASSGGLFRSFTGGL